MFILNSLLRVNLVELTSEGFSAFAKCCETKKTPIKQNGQSEQSQRAEKLERPSRHMHLIGWECHDVSTEYWLLLFLLTENLRLTGKRWSNYGSGESVRPYFANIRFLILPSGNHTFACKMVEII